MSKKLTFGRQELQKAFGKFTKISGGESESTAVKKDFILYAIYAVECGLKNLLLIQRNIHTTEMLDEADLTHDLNGLLQKVGINNRSSFRFNQFQRANKRGTNESSISSGKLHELYRYGGRLDIQCEEELRKKLSQLCIEIKNQLQG